MIKRDHASTNIAYITLKSQADVQKLLNTRITLQGKKIHLVQYQRKETQESPEEENLVIY
jgi:hypothetical protein